MSRLAGADAVVFDGTCFTNDELAARGLGTKTARDMGHQPLTGPGGSLAQLAALGAKRLVLAHVNNSNPILIEGSPERRLVEAAGAEVGFDGMEILA
jgi:pyrroloquinoline quinone biosynthesis protein B